MGGPGLFCGVFEGVDTGVEHGVLAVELGAEGVLSIRALPFTKTSLSLNSFAPFFAFLNKTEVRRPTPPVVGLSEASGSDRPLATACPSMCNIGGGDTGRSCVLVQLVVFDKSLSNFRRLQGQL